MSTLPSAAPRRAAFEGRRRTRARCARAGLVLLVILAACSRKPEPQDQKRNAAEDKPVRGGTVVVGIGTEPEQLIPYGAPLAQNSNIMGLIFMQLTYTDSDLVTIQPSLAKSWDWSPDHKSLTMHLREDVQWSDGMPFTSEDAVFSHEVARDSVVAWSTRSWKQTVKHCEALDRFTVRYDFDEEFPDQLRYVGNGLIVPKHLLQNVPREHWGTSAFGRQPVGCGPFKLERWESQQRLVLVRNDNYFDKPKPYLDRVVFEIDPDANTRLTKLRAGQIDLLEEDMLPLREAAALRQAWEAGRSPVRIVSGRGRFYDYIGYNSRDPLFASRKVREALTRGIDRKSIIDRQCYGFAELFESPIVPILWAYNPQQPITPYDPEGAKRLLAEEGWRDTDGDSWLDKNGKRFQFSVLCANDNPQRRDVAVLVQSYWKALGVQADVQSIEKQVAGEKRKKKDFQAYFGGWSAALTPNVQNVWGCDRIEKGLNYVSYCNPRVDSLNKVAVRSPMETARPLFHEIQRLVAQDYPYTWLYYGHQVVALNRRVHGALIDLRGAFNNPEEWWIADERQANR